MITLEIRLKIYLAVPNQWTGLEWNGMDCKLLCAKCAIIISTFIPDVIQVSELLLSTCSYFCSTAVIN